MRLPLLFFSTLFIGLSSCASYPHPQHTFSDPLARLASRPELANDLELILQRVDRADVRLHTVSPEAIPRATQLWTATGVRTLPIVIDAESDSTQCEERPGYPCTFAGLFAMRSDGAEAGQFQLRPPQPIHDPAKELLWALGMTTLVLPVGALAFRDPNVMAPPEATPPAEDLRVAYENLVAEQKAAGLYTSRRHGSRLAFGYIYRREAVPIATMRVELTLRFRKKELCRVDFDLSESRFNESTPVRVGRNDVTRVSCPRQLAP